MGAEYSGVRLRMIAALGRTKIHTQIDLGFSEAVIEEPMRANLPVRQKSSGESSGGFEISSIRFFALRDKRREKI